MTFKVMNTRKVKTDVFKLGGEKLQKNKKTPKNTLEANYQSKDYFNRKEIKILL